MFKLVIASIFLLPLLANAAQEKVIKACETTINWSANPDEKDPRADISIYIKERIDKTLHAITVSTSKKMTQTFDEQVQVIEESVRPGLTETSMEAPGADDDLNRAETVITGAMVFTGELVGKKMTSGIDLTKVRKARLYIVGKETRMGATTIVEAYDQDGKLMGSFLGGSIAVGKCK